MEDLSEYEKKLIKEKFEERKKIFQQIVPKSFEINDIICFKRNYQLIKVDKEFQLIKYKKIFAKHLEFLDKEEKLKGDKSFMEMRTNIKMTLIDKSMHKPIYDIFSPPRETINDTKNEVTEYFMVNLKSRKKNDDYKYLILRCVDSNMKNYCSLDVRFFILI